MIKDMNFKLDELNNLDAVIDDSNLFLKKRTTVRINNNKNVSYQLFNKLCSSMHRIRDTTNYLNQFKFKTDNTCGQAFDFIEFLNCMSIIKTNIESLFNIFKLELKNFYPKIKVFKKSNLTRKDDLTYFNFIRSAAFAHSTNTTRYNKLTKRQSEFYPYIIWTHPFSNFLESSNHEISLIAWNSKSKCKNRTYKLYISEFNNFLCILLSTISHLVPIAKENVERFKCKINCKVLKSRDNFKTDAQYCLYLLKRIKSKNSKVDGNIGGLLLASHILDNPKIGSEFKKYINSTIDNIATKMKIDLENITSNEIFSNLYLANVIENERSHYIAEKYHKYLYLEALQEINNQNFPYIKNINYYYNNDVDSYSNADYSIYLLITLKNDKITKILSSSTYCEAYELILEYIYKHSNKKDI